MQINASTQNYFSPISSNNTEFVIYLSNISHHSIERSIYHTMNNAYNKNGEQHGNYSYSYISIVLGASEFKIGTGK